MFLGRSTKPEYDNVTYMGTFRSFERVRLFNSDSQVVYAPPATCFTCSATRFSPGPSTPSACR